MIKYILITIVLLTNIYSSDIKLTKAEEHYLKTHTITIGTEVWKPIVYKEDNKLKGIIGDIINKSLAHLPVKIKLKIEQDSWDKIFNKFKDHQLDVLPALYYSKQREEYGNYSKKLFTLNEYLYVKENSTIKNFHDLEDKKIAIIKGYVMIDKIHKKYPTINIIQTKNLNQSFKLLLEGKVDAIIDGQIIVEDFIKSNLIIGVKSIYQNSFEANDIYLITNIQKPILKSIFAKALNSLTAKEKDEIFKTYNLEEHMQGLDYSIVYNFIFIFIAILALFLYRQSILKDANKKLQLAVEEKTKALININNNLEKAIDEEIKKARKIERKLYETQKMVSISDLITNISHQWRQPLSVITTTATGLLMKQEMNMLDDENLRKNLKKINDKAQYMSKTIDDFKVLITIDENKEPIKLKDVVNKCLSLQETIITQMNIKVIKNLDETIILNTYSNALIQSITNILNNAIDAIQKIDPNDKFIFINTYKKKQNAIIEIYDNANGIPNNILNKIFEAYFTTKHKSQGTGLALNITYNTIKNTLDGDIEVQNYEFTYNNNNYKGAKFIIILPLS